MATIVTEEIKKSKLFQGTAFRYKLGETKRIKFKRALEKKSGEKVQAEVLLDIQKSMRKYAETFIKGKLFDEDCDEITYAVMKDLQDI